MSILILMRYKDIILFAFQRAYTGFLFHFFKGHFPNKFPSDPKQIRCTVFMKRVHPLAKTGAPFLKQPLRLPLVKLPLKQQGSQ